MTITRVFNTMCKKNLDRCLGWCNEVVAAFDEITTKRGFCRKNKLQWLLRLFSEHL